MPGGSVSIGDLVIRRLRTIEAQCPAAVAQADSMSLDCNGTMALITACQIWPIAYQPIAPSQPLS